MAVVVEHDKRREKILEKALLVFIEDGFVDATYQKIADRCGIARTILYLYFKNKSEIFNYSIKQMLASLDSSIDNIRRDNSLDSAGKITKILHIVFKALEQNRRLLYVILDYILYLSKKGVNPEERIRRRTVKMRRALSSVIIEGVKSGELKKTKIKTASDYIYSFVETAIFSLVVLNRKTLADLKETATFAVKQLAV